MSLIIDQDLKEKVSAKDGNFKKIINKSLNESMKNKSTHYCASIITTKCAMDFYEEMTLEAARDNQQ